MDLSRSVVEVGSVRAEVEAVVIFNICDCYVRRPSHADRVIGTLLGSLHPDGTVRITNSYAVPHNHTDGTVWLDLDYQRNMLNSHHKVNPNDQIVGWYSTGLGVSGYTPVFQDFYNAFTPNALHLTVDTAFTNGKPTIRAYSASNLSLRDRPLAALFHQIPLTLRPHSLDLHLLNNTSLDNIPSDLHAMESSMDSLLTLIDDVLKYVNNVVDGNIAPDNAIGRFISQTVSSVPKLTPVEFDKLLNDTVEDHLLLIYLSSITRTQLSLAEKLNTAAQIL